MLQVDADTILTPAARDAAKQYGIEVVVGRSSTSVQVQSQVSGVQLIPPRDPKSSNAGTVVALGADHGGFVLKTVLAKQLGEWGYTVVDVGTSSEQPCDYPDFAFAVAALVSRGQAVRGVMIDSVGVASAIVANKVPGIRAVCCSNEFTAKSSREHNDANVLTLGGKVLGTELAKSILKVWLETWFGGGRHQNRIRKIAEIEERFLLKPTSHQSE
ncbi:MAG: ribose 5-phosphate isomerase B [Ignavibacteriales bacterium]|nr:ribose 5-phosphate isomerase B [Ignavibacteriales bacterium]